MRYNVYITYKREEVWINREGQENNLMHGVEEI